ncbi:hypothetical protein [Paraburkholderia hayleyella]|uniref:hypothetical protein n=1 Tax=Paraburkholderia hayleyella TaxID=2152889 RepID=UPI001290FAE0|nr:hypothetical protein [Paraburkholderia hayleyella]
MRHTVIGLFDSLAQAQTAQTALIQTGFVAGDIVLQTSAGLAAEAPTNRPGMLADIERFLASLFAAAPRQSEAQHYMDAVRRGAVLLYIDTANEAQTDLARSTLANLGATDIGERTPDWDEPYAASSLAREHSILDELGIGASAVSTPVSGEPHGSTAGASVTALAAGAAAGLGAVFQRESGATPTHQVASAPPLTPAAVPADSSSGRTQAAALQNAQIPDEFLEYEEDFRGHYDTQYAADSTRYEDYVSAYRYGATIAQNPRYQSQGWDELEPRVRQEWEDTLAHGGAWEHVKTAVRHGWERATARKTNH